MKQQIQLHPADNVAVVLTDDHPVAPRGHKIALKPIPEGCDVIKYGFPIGHATHDIANGEWVHTHNLATNLGLDERYTYHPTPYPAVNAGQSPTVDGYLRPDNNMGIRNELWIVPTVGCVNGQAQIIAEKVKQQCDLAGIDDVRAFTHNYGCSQLGQDHENTRQALAAMIKHPNAGGVLVLGLGCENNQVSELKKALGDYNPERVKFITAQDVDDEIKSGVDACLSLAERMRHDRRQALPVSKLKIGLKCGGSDGLSGITANPLLGKFSDILTSWGATTILTEVPEMFGAETILMNRAKDLGVFNKIVGLINNFKSYYRSCGQPIYENPSPGNKAGGITTLEEKSLGCVLKGGTSTITDVLDYAQPSSIPGLNLISAPGNDLVASTALALSGCQLVLFTTGRGTPFGTFVPTMKISTNTQLSLKKPDWIDFDAGILLETGHPDEIVASLIKKVIATSSGARVCHEKFGTKDFAIFKTGVTL